MRIVVEIPEGGGLVGEDPLPAAQRELAEEAGLEAKHWQEIQRVHLSNSVSDEMGIIYVATGEGLHRPDLSVGDGIFKSTDGGQDWKHIGLKDTRHICGNENCLKEVKTTSTGEELIGIPLCAVNEVRPNLKKYPDNNLTCKELHRRELRNKKAEMMRSMI